MTALKQQAGAQQAMTLPQDRTGTRLSLTAELNHAADSLGLYRAELARILGLMCGDVSGAGMLQTLSRADSEPRRRAERFVCIYRLLEQAFAHDDVAMVHWMRRSHASLGTTPLLAIVDDGRMDDVIALLRPAAGEAAEYSAGAALGQDARMNTGDPKTGH